MYDAAKVQAKAERIPRYQPITFADYEDMVAAEEELDECIFCSSCSHFFELPTTTRRKVANRMRGPSGSMESEKRHCTRAKAEAMMALNEFGVCEVKGELIPYDDIPCDFLEER